ncbi:hypothetical protein PF010_g17919 [Phytophthora fragariae]|uniref:Uncharacterized protein n=1 Tax=Phytophthora fragariae TaxID=53985 RepID=A0A6G0KMJ0_9STRA|nr:hypothetical protein PF010_g17919 [Phytophthora fragariae]
MLLSTVLDPVGGGVIGSAAASTARSCAVIHFVQRTKLQIPDNSSLFLLAVVRAGTRGDHAPVHGARSRVVGVVVVSLLNHGVKSRGPRLATTAPPCNPW